MQSPIRESQPDPVDVAEAIVREAREPEPRYAFWWDEDAVEIGFRTL